MPNIRPVSDLENYDDVLRDIAVGDPVVLTDNGKDICAILNIDEYKRTKAVLTIMESLLKGERSANENGWVPFNQAVETLGIGNEL